jgi:hypothetical protein
METLYFVLANLTIVGFILWFARADKRPEQQSKGPFGISSVRSRNKTAFKNPSRDRAG